MQFPRIQNESNGTQIDMTPMIDVVFLLVTFWMVVTAISSPDSDGAVLPPVSKLAERGLAAQRVVLQVRRGESAVFGFRGRVYDLPSLARRLDVLAEREPGGRSVLGRDVLIRVDGFADSGRVGALLGVLRRLGVRRVDFAARIP